mgnify:CR=1 FL=1
MPKATGATEHWNTSHRGYFCLHDGHPPNKKAEIDYCVTPETEAHALLALRGNWNCWHAQFQTADKHPNYKQKTLHNWPSPDVIQASNHIKLWLYREQRNMDDLTPTPEGWEADMKLLEFKGAILADKDAEKPNQVRLMISAFLAAIHWLLPIH